VTEDIIRRAKKGLLYVKKVEVRRGGLWGVGENKKKTAIEPADNWKKIRALNNDVTRKDVAHGHTNTEGKKMRDDIQKRKAKAKCIQKLRQLEGRDAETKGKNTRSKKQGLPWRKAENS